MSEPARFFHAVNANRTILAEGHRYNFEPYALAGTWLGVFQAETPEDQQALAKLTGDPKSGVTEIDAAEYEKCVKKKLKVQPPGLSLSALEQSNQGKIPAPPAPKSESEPEPEVDIAQALTPKPVQVPTERTPQRKRK